MAASLAWAGQSDAQDASPELQTEAAAVELPELVITTGDIESGKVKRKKGSGQGPVVQSEEFVVTATRNEQTIASSGSSVSVLSQQEIESSGERTLLPLLNRVPGVYATQVGGVGANSTVRIRGADSDQTLVLIDGMRVNDPSSPQGDFDFAAFALTDVERIEVLKGPQSAVWGGDAIGGVINIITPRGEGPAKARASIEGGSYGTYKIGGSINGGTESGHYALSSTFLHTDGFSRNKLGTEEDGAEIFAFSGRGGYKVAPNYFINVAAHISSLKADTDPSLSSASGDGPGTSERFLFSGQIDNIVTTGTLENKLSVFSLYADREATNPRLATPTTYYTAESYGVEYQGTLRAQDNLVLTFGGRFQEDQAVNEVGGGGKSKVTQFDGPADNYSGFLQAAWNPLDNLYLTLAGRSDDFGLGGLNNTWRTTTSYLLAPTSTRFHASYGTGAKPPTMYQSYFNGPDPIYGGTLQGNPDLAVETSEGYDVGIEQSFFDKRLSIDATYFQQDIENMIVYEIVQYSVLSTYNNVDNVSSEGVEVSLSARPVDWLNVTGGYTYLISQDQATHLDLARTPRETAFVGVQLAPADPLLVGVEVRYVGPQFNRSQQRDPLDAFTLVNLTGSWKLDDRTEVFARAENLFDVDYEVIKNVGEPGRSGYLGLRMSLN